jgi:hypothetical protein
MGGLFVDLKLKGLDAAQMNDLGGVMDEILAAQMEIIAENEVSASGEDTMGEDSEDEESFAGKGTHNPAAPEFKAGAIIVYLGQKSQGPTIQRISLLQDRRQDEQGAPPRAGNSRAPFGNHEG